jgi:hypothetical protein
MIRSLTRWIALTVLCLPLTCPLRAEDKPRPPEDGKGRGPDNRRPTDKWAKGQIKDKYNKAASGTKDKDKRDEKQRGSEPVSKTDKWAKNQIKDKYNQAANPKK